MKTSIVYCEEYLLWTGNYVFLLSWQSQLICDVKVNCSISPACVCRAPCESVIHYLLHCPRYAALRQNLLSAAAHLLKDRWSNLLDFQKCNVLLLGSNDMTFDENKYLFKRVQTYIKESMRFAKS